ncbi:hypothetical protein DMENIID0001_081120 [Sergentomyia squamirostris]
MDLKSQSFEINEIPESVSEEEPVEIDVSYIGSILNAAKDVLLEHQDIDPYNAIQINQKYINYLTALRERVVHLITMCSERGKEIDEILENKDNVPEKRKKKLTKWQGARAYGYPFFKNRFGKRPADNEDQKAMVARGELIPRDFVYMKKKNWTLMDQKNLLDGIKSSMKKFHKGRIQQAISVLKRRRQQEGRLEKINNLLKGQNTLDEISFMNLWKYVKDCEDFKVNWDDVSEVYVKQRHTAGECEAMWSLHLRPELKRTLWTLEEEDEMLNAVQEVGEHNWEEVAERVEGRSAFQCFVQYQANFGISARLDYKKKFTPEEDERILELVEKYRFGNAICWTRLGSEFENRSKHSIYKRYHYTLKENIIRGRFSNEEDCILMAAIEQYGMNFSRIVREVMPNRTVPQLRNRYQNSLMFVGNNNKWTAQEDELLMKLADDDNKTWSEIAKILRTHNRISCRTRYFTIRKFLDANPTKAVSDVPKKHRRLTTEVTLSNWKEKIVELQSEPVEKKTDPYEKTSQIDQRYFNFFYPAYDFHLGEMLQPLKPITNNLFHMSKILNVQLTKSQLNMVQHHLTKNQFDSLCAISGRSVSSSCTYSNNTCLPVSWNTIVAFRGVAATLAITKTTTSSQNPSTASPEVEEFKRRFRKMFYWTAMLSQVKMNLEGDKETQEASTEASTEVVSVPEGPSCSREPSTHEEDEDNDEMMELVIEADGQSFVVKASAPKEERGLERGTKRSGEVEMNLSIKRIKDSRDIA